MLKIAADTIQKRRTLNKTHSFFEFKLRTSYNQPVTMYLLFRKESRQKGSFTLAMLYLVDYSELTM